MQFFHNYRITLTWHLAKFQLKKLRCICVIYNTKVSEFAIGQSFVNLAKLRVDTLGPCLKTETIRSQTGESKFTKTTGTINNSLYSISSGVRDKSSINFIEGGRCHYLTWTIFRTKFTGIVHPDFPVLLA